MEREATRLLPFCPKIIEIGRKIVTIWNNKINKEKLLCSIWGRRRRRGWGYVFLGLVRLGNVLVLPLSFERGKSFQMGFSSCSYIRYRIYIFLKKDLFRQVGNRRSRISSLSQNKCQLLASLGHRVYTTSSNRCPTNEIFSYSIPIRN